MTTSTVTCEYPGWIGPWKSPEGDLETVVKLLDKEWTNFLCILKKICVFIEGIDSVQTHQAPPVQTHQAPPVQTQAPPVQAQVPSFLVTDIKPTASDQEPKKRKCQYCGISNQLGKNRSGLSFPRASYDISTDAQRIIYLYL